MTFLPTSFADNEIILKRDTSPATAYRLALKGPITVNKATQHAGKVTIGETSRSDQVLADEWVMTDWRDGLLIDQLDEQVHRGRFWWGDNVSTTTRRKVHLGLRNYSVTLNETATCVYLLEYFDGGGHKIVFAAFDNGNFYRINLDGSTTATDLVTTLSYLPTSHVVFNSILYIFTGSTTYYTYNYITQTFSTIVSTKGAFKYAVVFDVNPTQKVVAIDVDNLLWATINPSVDANWDSSVGGQLKDQTITNLVAFRNVNDDPTVVICTTKGLFIADIYSRTIYPSSLSLLENPDAGKGSVVWGDGSLYFSDSLAVWRYPRAGGQITNIGLDRDNGLPALLATGKIEKLITHPNYLIAAINVKSATGYSAFGSGMISTTGLTTTVTGNGSTKFTTECLEGASIYFAQAASPKPSYTIAHIVSDNELTLTTIPIAYGNVSPQTYIRVNYDLLSGSNTYTEGNLWGTGEDASTMNFPDRRIRSYNFIMIFNGTGWHNLWINPSITTSTTTNTQITSILLTSGYRDESFQINNQRRLYFAYGPNIKYIVFPEGNYDPTLDSAAQFNNSGFAKTSWFDAGYSEIDKLALSLKVNMTNCSSSNPANTMTISYVLDNNESDFDTNYVTLGTVSTDGNTTFSFPPSGSNSKEGIVFRSIRLKFAFSRSGGIEGTTVPRTGPIMNFFDLRFKKMSDILWGYNFKVVGEDLEQMRDVWRDLKSATETKGVWKLYMNPEDDADVSYVEIVGVTGIRRSGKDRSCSFNVTCVELVI